MGRVARATRPALPDAAANFAPSPFHRCRVKVRYSVGICHKSVLATATDLGYARSAPHTEVPVTARRSSLEVPGARCAAPIIGLAAYVSPPIKAEAIQTSLRVGAPKIVRHSTVAF